MESGAKTCGATGLGQITRPKVNFNFEVREIDNGFIISGWNNGVRFETYRDDMKQIVTFIETTLRP